MVDGHWCGTCRGRLASLPFLSPLPLSRPILSSLHQDALPFTLIFRHRSAARNRALDDT